MKVSRRRKNDRLKTAGVPIPANAPVCHGNLDVIDPDQFVLETLTALKKLPVGKLTGELRQQVAGWVPPKFTCPACARAGLLTECIRDTRQQVWLCPVQECLTVVKHDPVS